MPAQQKHVAPWERSIALPALPPGACPDYDQMLCTPRTRQTRPIEPLVAAAFARLAGTRDTPAGAVHLHAAEEATRRGHGVFAGGRDLELFELLYTFRLAEGMPASALAVFILTNDADGGAALVRGADLAADRGRKHHPVAHTHTVPSAATSMRELIGETEHFGVPPDVVAWVDSEPTLENLQTGLVQLLTVLPEDCHAVLALPAVLTPDVMVVVHFLRTRFAEGFLVRGAFQPADSQTVYFVGRSFLGISEAALTQLQRNIRGAADMYLYPPSWVPRGFATAVLDFHRHIVEQTELDVAATADATAQARLLCDTFQLWAAADDFA